jgi:hypothetical protein
MDGFTYAQTGPCLSSELKFRAIAMHMSTYRIHETETRRLARGSRLHVSAKNSRGEDQDAGCHATQHDGEWKSGPRANLSNLADRLMHVIIVGNHQRQPSYAETKNGSG